MLCELMQHLVDRCDLSEDRLDRALERFAGLDPAILLALGGFRFAALPVHMVGSGL